ncbi:MAG: hypothetical protein ACOC44_09870 [Promethearchaeia archaeon]
MSAKEFGELKFIASMFRMAMKEFNNVVGPESIRTIFRLIGENQGKAVAQRMREKFNIENWTAADFADKFPEDVLDPVLGEGNSEVSSEGNKVSLILKECPFKRAGIDINNRFYCTYTEGLIETTAQELLENVLFTSEKLRAVDDCDCTFLLEVES